MSDDENQTIIIDAGSSLVKAGFHYEPEPSLKFPPLIGHPRGRSIVNDLDRVNSFIGSKAQQVQGILTLRNPLEKEKVKNWDDMEKIWDHTFLKLGANYEECFLLLTEPPLNVKANRERMTQIMFETYHVPGLYVAGKAPLSLFASGHRTGLVLTSTESNTYAVPIYENSVLPHATTHMDLAGRDLTELLMHNINELGYLILDCRSNKDSIRELKEKHCYIAQDFSQESLLLSEVIKKRHILPDGSEISIEKEQFTCPEALFQPHLAGLNKSHSIQNVIYQSIMKCDQEIRQELFNNIILSGGNTMFTGMKTRIEKEMKAIVGDNYHVKVHSPCNRRYSSWLGGACLAKLSQFNEMCISSEEYDEYGYGIVHRKCF